MPLYEEETEYHGIKIITGFHKGTIYYNLEIFRKKDKKRLLLVNYCDFSFSLDIEGPHIERKIFNSEDCLVGHKIFTDGIEIKADDTYIFYPFCILDPEYHDSCKYCDKKYYDNIFQELDIFSLIKEYMFPFVSIETCYED